MNKKMTYFNNKRTHRLSQRDTKENKTDKYMDGIK